VTGLSEYVVSQYQQIIRESKKDKKKRDGIEDIVGQHLNYNGIKKTLKSSGRKAAVSMGGFE
jgi:hypothetical protein